MTKRLNRSPPVRADTLECCQTTCPHCAGPTWQHYTNVRTILSLQGSLRLSLHSRTRRPPSFPPYRKPYRPQAQGRFALAHHEFGLDLITEIGLWRYGEQRSVPQIHTLLRARDLPSSERSVTNLLDRYDHLLALSVLDVARLRRLTKAHKRLILALDGLQPDAGHEVLWLLRECLSGQILLCRSLLSATQTDLAWLLEELRDALDLPSAAVVWDGQRSIRNAVARVFASVAHQLSHFHSLPEAAMPLFQADRHAKKELKKRERGIRPLERALEQRDAREATLVRG